MHACKWNQIHQWIDSIDSFFGTESPSPRTTKYWQGRSWVLATNVVWMHCLPVIHYLRHGLLWYAIKQFIWNENKVFHQAFSKGQKRNCNNSLYPQPWTHATVCKGFRFWERRERHSFERGGWHFRILCTYSKELLGYLPTKVCLVKAMVFPVVMYGYESWTIKKAEHQRIDAFELWCWRRLLSIPWTARRSNQSILKEISPEYSLEGLILKLKLQYFGHLMRRTDSFEKTMMLGKIEGRRRRGR